MRAIIFLLLFMSVGCFASIDENRIVDPPVPSSAPMSSDEKTVGENKLEPSVEDNLIKIHLYKPLMCSTQVKTPMVQHVTLERHVGSSTYLAKTDTPQAWNTIGILTLGGLGTLLVADPCVGTKAGETCDSSQRNNMTIAGGTALGLAGINAIILAANAAQAHNDEKIEAAPTKIEYTHPYHCGDRNLSGTIFVNVEDKNYALEASKTGITQFDLAKIIPTQDLVDHPIITVRWSGGLEKASIDLSSPPRRIYMRWKDMLEQQRKDAEEQSRKEIEELHKREEACVNWKNSHCKEVSQSSCAPPQDYCIYVNYKKVCEKKPGPCHNVSKTVCAGKMPKGCEFLNP